MNCASFFYQWRVYSSNRHKLTVVSHRDQKSFNVAVMKYRNSIVYVQRQIDRLLRIFRSFARAYVDNIVIAFTTLKEHLEHLHQVFEMLIENNIFIKLIKIFVEYSTVQLLDQKINFFDLFISKEKLLAIAKLKFSIILNQLKTYLELIEWLREYVFFYARVSKSLQNRKTKLLRNDLVADRKRKSYFAKTKIRDRTQVELAFFLALQRLLFKSFYLIHSNKSRHVMRWCRLSRPCSDLDQISSRSCLIDLVRISSSFCQDLIISLYSLRDSRLVFFSFSSFVLYIDLTLSINES